MPDMVDNFVRDGWHTASDDGTVVLDASTGEPVARVSSTGVDFAAAAHHARTVGGPALRRLTFHQRAALLKALAAAVTEHRSELYDLSATTGATVRDAQFDVDGGIGVLASYASRARRELPDGVVLLDGDVERLGKHGTAVGRHVYTSRHGVAVLVNAFNFPVWGMLEKMASALLAGVPVIVKAATPTAHVAAAAFRRMVASGALPPGAAQFVAGGVGDLFEHLTGQDSIAFTGSADTAARLRSHPAVLRETVRFNAEADSLNCSVLGPDAAPGTPEFDLYIDAVAVAGEMLIKSGQRCTAIRRALVPAHRVDAVIDELARRLADVRIGDPRDPETTLGPLVSRAQLEDVSAKVERLAAGADLVVGGPGEVKIGSGDAERGAFLPPTVLRARSPEWADLHDVEAFGPVTSVIGYRDAVHAVDLAARGSGSLVASVVTHDPGFARDVVLGLAPYHGRCLVLDRDNAKESSRHGDAVPRLMHGGPGRAGGGAELGGMRSVLHHMQVTGVHSSPAMLTALTGRWVAGAPVTEGGTHPFRRRDEDLEPGVRLVTGARTVTREDVARFAHGSFVVSVAADLIAGPAPAVAGVDGLRLLEPVRAGDTLRVVVTCKAKEGDGTVRWDVTVVNQDDATVAAYDLLTRPPAGG